MPMYDYKCEGCGRVQIDVLEPIQSPTPPCASCGNMMRRVWLASAPSVIPDSIIGGVDIKHGLCGPGGAADPIRYYSKTEIRKAAEKKGLVNHVEHVESQGSSKNPNTQRWI